MNNQTFNPEALEASAKASFENASQAFGLVLDKTTQLLEKNVAAARTTVERHATYASSLKDIRDVEDFVKVQESISRTEAEAFENFSREIYELSSTATAELTKVNETYHAVTKDLVSESLEHVAKAIPNSSAQPYGSFFKDVVRTQIEAFNNFNAFVEKTVSAQQASFSALAEASATKVAKGKKVSSKGK